MPKPPLDPHFADVAPTSSVLTAYDEHCMLTYMRLLDASADGADWREVAHTVLHIDPNQEPERHSGLGRRTGARSLDDRE
ncbi:hypothetical protein [Mesorhizobium onobrychidis]|uniref:hypothetical protein n=1 Tax=Mesorhizobium onobrychidis TaxID=2775404 RepID=UPI002867D454|nr:hypothetical protein [Mesorhizobium onobrychidis]